jgi:hypothetical protein
LSSIQQANQSHATPAGESAGQPFNRVFERYRGSSPRAFALEQEQAQRCVQVTETPHQLRVIHDLPELAHESADSTGEIVEVFVFQLVQPLALRAAFGAFQGRHAKYLADVVAEPSGQHDQLPVSRQVSPEVDQGLNGVTGDPEVIYRKFRDCWHRA